MEDDAESSFIHNYARECQKKLYNAVMLRVYKIN
jgi:hypothetical protein